MTKDEALKLALEALERYETKRQDDRFAELITAIKEALAQPSDSVEQESLEYWNAVEGWVKIEEVRQHFETVSCGTIYKTGGEGRVPLYTSPPIKCEWVELEVEHIDEITSTAISMVDAMLLTEEKLKELNK